MVRTLIIFLLIVSSQSQAIAQSFTAEDVSELYFDAARAGDGDILESLIQAGAPVNATNKRGFTAFILAAYNDKPAAVSTLAANGANPCLGDGRGNTALMGVAFQGHDEMARQLLTYDCPVDQINNAGQTALMLATLFARTDQVTALLQAGANPRLPDDAGNTAISLAETQGHDALQLLLEQGV